MPDKYVLRTVEGGNNGLVKHQSVMKVKQWIEERIQEELPEGKLEDILHSGTILCRLIKSMDSDLLPSFNKLDNPFAHRDNIALFLNACEKHGLQKWELFDVNDLYEKNRTERVLETVTKLIESKKEKEKSERRSVPTLSQEELMELRQKALQLLCKPYPTEQEKENIMAENIYQCHCWMQDLTNKEETLKDLDVAPYRNQLNLLKKKLLNMRHR